jgi:hypothetical protein
LKVKSTRRKWFIGATAIFAVLIVLWVLAAIQLSDASARGLSFPFNLRSNLAADYSQDDQDRRLGSLRLSIVSDFLRDIGLSQPEADEKQDDVEDEMDKPVPTATALNFEGDAPFTATPTFTPTPTHTFTPSPTPTPTNTPTPKPTRTSTKTPKPPEPEKTDTPVGSVDTSDPQICCVVLNPPETSTLEQCTITVDDVHIFDPAFSSGIEDSQVYVYVDRPSSSRIYQTLNISSGGFVSGPGSDWDAHYEGEICLDGLSAGDTIRVSAKVRDSAGNGWIYFSPEFIYTLAVDCP